MRMGAFLLGGLIGAAAVVYFNSGRSWSFAGMSGRASKAAGKGSKSNAVFGTGKSSDSTWSKAGFDDLEQLIEKDPTVKSQVGEILNKSGKVELTQ